MLNDILWPDHIQWEPPTDQTLYRTRPFTEFWVVSIEHLRRVWHADRGRLLLRTPGPVPLGLAYVLLVETNPFSNLSLFYRTLLFEYPSVLSRFCLSKINKCTYPVFLTCITESIFVLPPVSGEVKSSCVTHHDGLYINGTLFRTYKLAYIISG